MNNKSLFNLIALLIILILFLVSFYFVGLSYVSSHELIHQKIFERYGINSTIKIDYKDLSGITTPLSNNGNCNDYCSLDHTINDVIGYYFIIFINAIFIILLLIGLYKEFT